MVSARTIESRMIVSARLQMIKQSENDVGGNSLRDEYWTKCTNLLRFALFALLVKVYTPKSRDDRTIMCLAPLRKCL
jgi:hypothetical protein